jgi:RND superfamily putative drug exporter
MPEQNFAARAGAWSAAHRKTAIFGWLAFVLIAFALGNAAGVVTLKSQDQGVGEARTANRVLAKEFPSERATEQVLIQNPSGRWNAPVALAAISDAVARLSQTAHVSHVRSPLEAANAGQVSKDGRSSIVTFDLAGDLDKAKDLVGPSLAVTAALQRAHPAVTVGQFGDGSINKAFDKRFAEDFRKAEFTSIPVTLLILLVAFGALVAAGIPLLLGLTAVFAALGLTAVFSHLVHVDNAINSVILLIGLAVGVDYSLFYLRRVREERARGRSPDAALAITAGSSGQAVLISGLTVMVAMCGMFLMGSPVFVSFGVGTVLVVAMAIIGSLTVLPAVISKLGDRVEKGRVPILSRRRRPDGSSRIWALIIGGVLRRPLLWGGLAVALLVALALPALSIHTVDSGAQGLPRDLPVMQVYDRSQNAFPGGPLPAQVVITAPNVNTAAMRAAIKELERRALATGQMGRVLATQVSSSGRAVVVSIPLAGKGTDTTSNRALDVLRGRLIPATVGRVPGAEARVTGLTAGSRDFNDSMKSHAPLVFAFVFSLAFLLLLVTFRSIVIPLTAIVLNMLSVGAAYGVLVLIFQRGNLESLLGFRSIGGVTSWLPLFLFVILFGLSMDYHVLILSRVRESHEEGRSTPEAVSHALRATASVVTSAAIVMVAVFAIFATLGMIDFKMMGVGLAVAVLLDATVVRAVLVPAAMKLLGEWNWYLPRWLEWLPRVGAGRSAPGAIQANPPMPNTARSPVREREPIVHH